MERCKHEASVADVGGGKSFCSRLGKWTNCREVGHCVADDLLGVSEIGDGNGQEKDA